ADRTGCAHDVAVLHAERQSGRHAFHGYDRTPVRGGATASRSRKGPRLWRDGQSALVRGERRRRARAGVALEQALGYARVFVVVRLRPRAVRRRRSAERSARSEAEQARRLAEQANRAKSEFLAIMSHELRTPLNAIAGYAELMEIGVQGPVSTGQREALERIQRSQRHLLGLINQVLNYARLETGNVRYALTDVPLDAMVRAAEALVFPQMQARGLRYSYAACDATLVSRADGEKLQQIMLNLLTNAAKFTERGGEIKVETEVAGELARLHVRDTGVGIPPDKLSMIFDPFVQVDS